MTESVWDFPRPPRVEPCAQRVRVEVAGVLVADSTRALRVLETSQAPGIYVPPEDVRVEHLRPSARRTWCEWKGATAYLDVVVGEEERPAAAWTYPDPTPGYEAIRHHVAFYPQRVDRALLDDELVSANGGDFYGGWISSAVTGPFKGAPGTAGW